MPENQINIPAPDTPEGQDRNVVQQPTPPPPLVPPGVPQVASPAMAMTQEAHPSVGAQVVHSQGTVAAAHVAPARLITPIARPNAEYWRVNHTSIGGALMEGHLVAREDFPSGIDFDRLVRLGAIRRATYDELQTLERLATKQHMAVLTARSEGRTDAEVSADLHAMVTTGNPLHHNIPGQ